MPATSVSTPRCSANASIATMSLVPSTRIAARVLELKGGQVEVVLALDRGECDREVLDREPGRVERRDLDVRLPSVRVSGQHSAELRHSAALELACLDRVHMLAVVARLLPVVREDPCAQQLVAGALRLGRACGTHQAHVLAGSVPTPRA